MHLSMNIISEQLSAVCTIAGLDTTDSSPAWFGFPTLYQSGIVFKPGQLYVASANELPVGVWLRAPIGLIVCGNAPESYVMQGCAILRVSGGISEAALYATVSEIFWKYQRWETRLYKLLPAQDSLQKQLEASYPLVYAPLFVCGKNGSVLAHIEENQNGSYDISSAFSGNSSPLDQLFANKKFQADWLKPQKAFETVVSAYENSWPCYYRRLQDEEGAYLGYLLLIGTHASFSESDKFVVNYLGDVLESSLNKMTELRGRQLWEGSYLFKNMLNGVPLSHAEFTHRLNEQGLAGHRFCCVRLALKQSSLSLPVESICWHINAGMKNVYATVFDSSIVLFLKLSKSTYFLNELPEQVNSFIKNGNFCAGVSHTFSAVRDTKHYYLQACKALDMGTRAHPEKDCYFFSDYALHYILNQNADTQPARTLCMEGIKMLKDLDQTNGSEYCRTLKTYFKNGMNLQKTANELFIHRSTLTYRLNRIRSEAKIDLDDYQSRLYAMMSLELFEL